MMKTIKKLFCLLTALALLTTIPVVNNSVSAESTEIDTDKPHIAPIPEQSTVKPGDTVKVNFCVDNNSGFWGAMLSYKFDEGLSLVASGKTDSSTGENITKYDTGKSFSNRICVSPVNDTNTVTFVYSNSNINYKNYYNGTIVSIYFKVDDDATEGEYSIDFKKCNVVGSLASGNNATVLEDGFDYYGTTITVSEDAQEEAVLGTPSVKATIAGQGSVKLAITAAENALSYEVYKVKSNYSSYEKIATLNSSTLVYYDNDVPEYNTYNYMIKAIMGDKYTYSKSVSVTVSPYLLVGTENYKPRLTWNSGTNATSYSIYRNAGGTNSSFSLIASGVTDDYYVDNSAISCVSYKYQVKAHVSAYLTKNSGYTTWNAAKSHTAGDWVTVEEPDFTQSGYREKYCTYCGARVSSEYLDSLYINTYMAEGASIRLGGANGIRFVTYISPEKVSYVESYGYTVTMGTLIGPEDLVGDTLDFEDVENGRAVDVVTHGFYNDSDCIAGSIAKIKEKNTAYSASTGNITRNFIGRGYAIAEKGDEKHVFLADYPNESMFECSRSLKTVSQALQIDEDQIPLYNAYKEQVDKWVAAEK